MSNSLIESNNSYRFWPVYVLAFVKTLYISIYSLALPNYLIIIKQIPAEMVGIIISVYTFAYIFGPFFGQRATLKIGIKNAVLLSSCVSVASIFLQLLFFQPALLIIFRILDGFFLGLFWTNIQLQVSIWQKNCSPEQGTRFFQKYNLSWNFGLLIGYILGFLIVILWENEFLAIILSAILSIIMIPIAIVIEKQSNCPEFHDSIEYEEDLEPILKPSLTSLTGLKKTTIKKKTAPILLPTIIFIVGCFTFASYKTLFNFLFPFFVKNAEWPTYSVYLIIFGQQVIQFLAIHWLASKKQIMQLNMLIFALICFILTGGIVVIFPSIWIIAICTMLTGIFYGLMYSVSTQIMLNHGAQTQSSKYVMIYEVSVGIGFTLSPFIAGYITAWNIMANFVIYGLVFLVVLIWFIVKIQNVKKTLLQTKQ